MRNMLGFKSGHKMAESFGRAGVLGAVCGFSPVASGETVVEVGITAGGSQAARAAIHDAGYDPRGLWFSRATWARRPALRSSMMPEEQAELQILQLDATDIRVKGAEVQSKVKQAELKRIKRLVRTSKQQRCELEKPWLREARRAQHRSGRAAIFRRSWLRSPSRS